MATVVQLGERIAFRFTNGGHGTMTREEMLLHVSEPARRQA